MVITKRSKITTVVYIRCMKLTSGQYIYIIYIYIYQYQSISSAVLDLQNLRTPHFCNILRG